MSDLLSTKWLNFMLRTIRDNKLGPTYVTRLLYLGSTIICYTIGLTKRKVKVNEPELKKVDSKLKSSDADPVIHNGVKYLYNLLGYPFDLPDVEIDDDHDEALEAFDNIKAFLDRRDGDGWRQAYVDADEADYYPNGDRTTNFIEVDTDPMAPQDLSFLTNKDKWTPLKHGVNIQRYLTPKWGEVQPLVDISEFISIYNANFNGDRDQDISDILRAYRDMTDRQRVIAEYFQGGKVSPPGIWNIWGVYAAIATDKSDMEFSEILYRLNNALFTASIVAWNAKYCKKQARPIQLIRLLPEQPVTTWDGTVVSNKIWKPFQQSNARTPPFPDFISGHSTFSGAASLVFNEYFGEDINGLSFEAISSEHADMISPLIENSYGSTVKKIMVNFGSSEVSQGAASSGFPTSAVTLDFNTWNQLAELSGISRIYGGIHGNSANGIGLLLGNLIAQKFTS